MRRVLPGSANSGSTGGAGGAGGLTGLPLTPPNPQITGVYPNFGSAAGEWTIYIGGANLSTVSTVKINGLACTSVTYHSSGTYAGLISCVTPAYLSATGSYKNGSTTGMTVQVTLTGGGIATSATNQQNYFYIPCNTAPLECHSVSAPLCTIATGVSNVASMLPSGGAAWAQSTGADQPTLLTNFNSTGLSALSFGGSPDKMALTQTGSTSTSWTVFVLQQIITSALNNGTWDIGGLSTTPGMELSGGIGSSYLTTIGGNASTGVIDTNAHVMWFQNTAGTTTFNQNTTVLRTVTAGGSLSNGSSWTLGQFNVSGYGGYGNLNIAADLVYGAAISSADVTTVLTILNAIYGAV